MRTKSYIYTAHEEILYSVIIPVHNQESIFVRNLQSILDLTVGNFEVIIILDYCYDKTEERLLKFLDSYENKNPYFAKVQIISNTDSPLFETKCDNIGFRLATGKYCLEIQADMQMTQKAYNVHLTKPFLYYSNVIAVSGRCAHNMTNPYGVGKLGESIEKTVDELRIDRNKFYVFETCNRGPLLIDRKKLVEMNFLNEEEYFLDNSDHDLMLRAYLEKKYICGYVPIDFLAPLTDGTMRKTTHNNCIEAKINLDTKNKLTEEMRYKPGLSRHLSSLKNRDYVILDI
jgi:glycosyltransferase involved in cell wall biosynthesis